MNVKQKIGKALTSKSVGTGPSSYEKRIYRAAVSQRLRNTGLGVRFPRWFSAKILQHSLLLPYDAHLYFDLCDMTGLLMAISFKL